MGELLETFETTQPWVIYTYGRTHDKWWPFWNSSRVLGRARIGVECCVCGHTDVVTLKLPRFGPVPEPASGRHEQRELFLAKHAHPDRGHPMSWVKALRNPAAFSGGIPLDLLAMRIQADVVEGSTYTSKETETDG